MSGLARRRNAYSYRISLVRERGAPLKSFRLRMPINGAEAARHFLADDIDRELFACLIVNSRNVVIAHNVISIGTINGSLVHPREVYKAAILASGAAIVCYHNHPSGDPLPSPEDRALTKRLKEAGRIVGIDMLDHIILGSSPADLGMRGESEASYYSFKERNEV